MKQRFAWILGILIVCAASGARADDAPVFRTYEFKTGGNTFECHPGVAPNGHNYPVPTRIILSTAYGASGLYFPTKIPLNNTEEVEFQDREAKPCSAFADLLQADGYSLSGKVFQKYTEHVGRAGTGECFRYLREDMVLKIGQYRLTGAQEFTVPSSDCP